MEPWSRGSDWQNANQFSCSILVLGVRELSYERRCSGQEANCENGKIDVGLLSPEQCPIGTSAEKIRLFSKEMEMASNNNPAKKKSRWASGITPYAEMGYYNADYAPKDTD